MVGDFGFVMVLVVDECVRYDGEIGCVEFCFCE